MQRQLVVISGPTAGRSFPLGDGQTLTIGRGQASDTQVNDPYMSRVHCRIQVDGGKTLLLDAESTSGTFVGGEKIHQRELAPGDVFRIGDTQIRYQLDSPEDATTLKPKTAFGRPLPEPQTKPLKGLVVETFHVYRLDEIISSSNSGMVFKAHDTEIDRPVAVKVLTPDPAHKCE